MPDITDPPSTATQPPTGIEPGIDRTRPPPPPAHRSSLLDRALAVATVLTPVAAVLIASMFSSASAKHDANLRMIELAIGILKSPATIETRDLRAWAIAIVNQYSEVDIPQAASNALRDSVSLPVSVTWTSDSGLSITPSGLVTAYKAGRYPVLVCVSGKCDTASRVTVVVPDTSGGKGKK